MSRFSVVQTIIGAVLTVLGLTVLSGWLWQIPALVQIKPGYVPMVFNTALCFTMAGAALAMPGLLRKPFSTGQALAGSLLLGICSATFAETVLDINLGIDWPFLHAWLQDKAMHPGRMAPNTALGFMHLGAALLLMHRVSNKTQAVAVQVLTFGALAIGLTGLVSDALAPDLSYSWARSTRMALHTALGMVLAAAALWLNWHGTHWYRSNKYFQEDEKISFMSGAVLIVMIITAGLTGFLSQQAAMEKSLKDSLSASLQHRMNAFQVITRQVAAAAGAVAQRAHVVQAAHRLALDRQDANALAQMALAADGMLAMGFSGVALLDLAGNEMVRAGSFVHTPGIVANLPFKAPAQLLWHDDLFMRIELPVAEGGTRIAKLRVERPLVLLKAQLFDTHGFGKTGEVNLCAGSAETLLCFPQPRNPSIYSIPRHSAFGGPLPIKQAVEGKTGLMETIDYRGNHVIAAHGTLAPELGLVIKQDAVELYGPIREQLQAIVPLLLLLVLTGMILLRSQLKPLVARLIASESKAAEREHEIRAVVSSVAEGIVTTDEQGMIQSFNAAASTIFGYPADAVIGRNITTLLPLEARAAYMHEMQHYLHSGESPMVGKPGIELSGLRIYGLPPICKENFNFLPIG